MHAGLWILRALAVLAMGAGLADMFAPRPSMPPLLKLAEYEWLVIIAGCWTLAWLAVMGRPRSLSRGIELVTWIALFAGVAWVLICHVEATAIAWGLMLSLRATLLAAWGFVVLGAPAVIVGIRQRRWRNAGQPWLVGRWWFATALTLALIEPTCAVWEMGHGLAVQKAGTNRLTFPQTLPTPPPGEWHIAAIGESTMRGWPYHPHSSIPQLAVWRLQSPHEDDEEPGAADKPSLPEIVIHNLALPGINLPWAINELQQLRYRPHVLLVYCGHNEFYFDMEADSLSRSKPFPMLDGALEYSPTFRVFHQWLERRYPQVWRMGQWHPMLADRPRFSRQRWADRLAQFRSRLEQLATFCEQQQIATVWFVPAAAEAGFEPNRSPAKPGTTAAARQRILDHYHAARVAEDQQDWSRAAEIYRQGLTDQPEFSEFHYRLGLCLRELGDYAAARTHLQAALEFDGHPVRMTREYREAVREIAQTHGFPIIDVDAVLRPATPHGILDRTVFLDDVHPTLKGQFLLGCALAETLQAPFETACGHAIAFTPVTLRDAVMAHGLDAPKLAAAYEQLSKGLEARVLLRFDPQERPAEARRIRGIAEKLRRGELPFDGTGIDDIDETACPAAGN